MQSKKLLAEFLGTLGLLVVVVGSGIMGEALGGGNTGIALLANSIATGAGLFALIQTFGSISGAHFNPAVSFIEFLWKRLSGKEFTYYTVAQIFGAILGVWITHAMFGKSIIQFSTHDRSEVRFLLSEVIATVGLILVIALSGKKNVHATPSAVSMYIVAAYWCTSSTSFANPAVTIARSLTNTFSGIQGSGVTAFIFAQILGSVIAFGLCRFLSKD